MKQSRRDERIPAKIRCFCRCCARGEQEKAWPGQRGAACDEAGLKRGFTENKLKLIEQ